MFSRIYAMVVDHRTGSGWRLPALDGLRAIAALLVLVAHAYAETTTDVPVWMTPLERGGAGGVVLFFVLSGFLLYLPWARSENEGTSPPRFKTYAIRRCLRIMPPYFASVILLSILRVALGGKEPLGLLPLLLHFVFLPTLISPLASVYWTLQTEEFFYWMLPAIHTIARKVGAFGALTIAVLISGAWLAIGLVVIDPSEHGHWLEQTPFFLPAFLLGIVSARSWVKNRTGPRAGYLALGGALLYIALCPIAVHVSAWTNDQATPITELAMAPAAALAVLGVARGGARFLEHPILRFIGGISFSLYLWHLVVIKRLPLPPVIAHSFGLRLLATLAISLPVACVSYFAFERPFLKLRPVDKPR